MPDTFPLTLETRTVCLEELALSRIVQEHKLALLVQSDNNHIMKRHHRTGLQGCNQGPAFIQVLLQVRPVSVEDKRDVSVPLEIPFHVRSIDPVRCVRMQIAVDLC